MTRKQMQGLPVKNKSSLSLVVHSRKADDTAADNAKGLPTDTATSHVEKRTGSVDGANAGGLSLDIAAMHLARGLEPLLVNDDIKVGAQRWRTDLFSSRRVPACLTSIYQSLTDICDRRHNYSTRSHAWPSFRTRWCPRMVRLVLLALMLRCRKRWTS